MIGSCNDDGIDVLVVEELAEVPVCPGARATAGSDTLFETRLIGVAHRDHVHVLLILEIEDVLRADESVADETDPNAIVRTQNAPVACGSRGRNYVPSRHSHPSRPTLPEKPADQCLIQGAAGESSDHGS